MNAQEEANGQSSYRVEVSGWDEGENFFVEKAVLSWSADEKKSVLLRTRLHPGSLIFVRLANQSPNNLTMPVTYQVLKIGSTQAGIGREVQLAQLHPKFV
jgi:hypothetical protein